MKSKPGTRNEGKGKVRETIGKAKEKIGRATGDRDLEERGKAERVDGFIQKKVGQVQKVFEK